MRLAALALAAALAPTALAQSSDDLDAVVITATRFPDVRRDLPVGVTVVTAQDLRRSATSNLPELLAQYGLVHVRDNAGTPNQQIDLRGFGITGDQNTLVLIDGQRISENELVPAQLNAIPLESIERIEIVRGSGAVQYGGGASGGVVNLITRRGRAGTARAYALGRAGGYGTVEGRAGLSQQEEAFGYSLDASRERTRGYRRNNRFEQTNAAARIEARSETARAYLRVAAGDQRLQLPGALTGAQIASDPRQASTPGDESERTDRTLALGGVWIPGRHEYAADVSVREKRANALFLPAFYVDTKVDVMSFAPRAKMRFDAFGREHEFTFGADWEQWDYENRSAASAAALGSPFSRRLGEQTIEALHAQASLWAAERTRIVLGARAQRTRERLSELVFPTDDRRARHSLDAHELAVRQGLAEGWSAYAKGGTSFRVATFDENACFVPPCAAVLLEPQTARAKEMGIEFERGAHHVRLAVYEMRLENEIYFSAAQGANVNLSPTRRRGAELEGKWRISEGLELRGSLALPEATFRSTGKEVPLVPDAIGTAGVSWSIFPRTRLDVNVRHVGAQRYDNDETNTFPRRQPAYTVADLKVARATGRLTLALEVRNVFDEAYYSYGVVNFLGTGFNAYPAPGRAAYASLEYRMD